MHVLAVLAHGHHDYDDMPSQVGGLASTSHSLKAEVGKAQFLLKSKLPIRKLAASDTHVTMCCCSTEDKVYLRVSLEPPDKF